MLNKKLSVLHLTYDYAQDNVGKSTVVIGNLINALSQIYSQKVINFNRQTKLKFLISKPVSDDNVYTVEHFGLPAGILNYKISKAISNYIIKNFDLNDIDFIHAHKLTFEGFIGFNLANKLNKKIVFSVRQTDFYVLKYRKDLISKIKEQITYASIIFIIAPYMKTELKRIFGNNFFKDKIERKIIFLPNIINLEKFKPVTSLIKEKFITICWLNKKGVKRKNLYRLLLAIKAIDSISLDIVGTGDYEIVVKDWIKKLDLEDRVTIKGFIPNDKISYFLGQSKALLMPSISETFGVAYAEALSCGVPILYSKNTGFDGIFNNVGVSVNPYSISDIIGGIIKIKERNNEYRLNIQKLNENKELEIFSEQNVRLTYINAINSFL